MNMSRIGLALIGLLAVSSCSPGADLPAADRTIAAFHTALNAGQFARIYATSSADMKAATTGEKFTSLLAAVHRKLGAFKSGSRTSWNDSVTTNGHYVTISYAAKYERGEAVENFVLAIADGKSSLAGYHVNSDALILN
jgi:hypothetical protein